jgi:ferredoxin--NADP+ reductase
LEASVTLNIACISYRTSTIDGLPHAPEPGRFPYDDNGFILLGLYASGWARRGLSGTIGTNRSDGFAVDDAIAADFAVGKVDGASNAGGRGDAADIARGRPGAQREKLVRVAEMLTVTGA